MPTQKVYNEVLTKLQRQYNNALAGKSYGSWILELVNDAKDLDKVLIEVVSVRSYNVYPNLQKAIEACPTLDTFHGGMKGQTKNGMLMVRFEDPWTYQGLSS